MTFPHAYFLTIHTYAIWRHGDVRGSVDRQHNQFSDEYLPANSPARRPKQAAFVLDDCTRQAVQQVVIDQAEFRKWTLWCIHTRTTHLHIVITAESVPEKLVNIIKAYSTRSMRELKLVDGEVRIWSRHASTRYLWDTTSIKAAIRYCIEEQGVPLFPKPFVKQDFVT